MNRLVGIAFAGAMLAGCGGTYQYFADSSPRLEASRYNYVKFHPGAPYNNDILSGRIRSGMSPEEVRAAWGPPNAELPGDKPTIQVVWAYQDPDKSHGNKLWILRFDSRLQEVESVRGMLLATGAEGAPQFEIELRPDSSGKP